MMRTVVRIRRPSEPGSQWRLTFEWALYLAIRDGGRRRVYKDSNLGWVIGRVVNEVSEW